MKKNILTITAILYLFSCAPYLLYDSTIPAFKPSAGNALIIYIRTLNLPQIQTHTYSTGTGGSMTTVSLNDDGTTSFIYLDGKYIGGLKAYCLTTFEAPPGEHIIIGEADFKGRMKLITEPDRVYYIEEMPFQMGPLGTKVNIQPVSRKEALQKIHDKNYRYTRPNPERLKDNLDEDDVKEAFEDWEEWAEEHPEDAQKELTYKGYPLD